MPSSPKALNFVRPEPPKGGIRAVAAPVVPKARAGTPKRTSNRLEWLQIELFLLHQPKRVQR